MERVRKCHGEETHQIRTRWSEKKWVIFFEKCIFSRSFVAGFIVCTWIRAWLTVCHVSETVFCVFFCVLCRCAHIFHPSQIIFWREHGELLRYGRRRLCRHLSVANLICESCRIYRSDPVYSASSRLHGLFLGADMEPFGVCLLLEWCKYDGLGVWPYKTRNVEEDIKVDSVCV